MNRQFWKSSAFGAAVLSSTLLIVSGCGDPNQKDGELVAPTEEVEASRAAMQNQLKENPNMYTPKKGSRGSGSR